MQQGFSFKRVAYCLFGVVVLVGWITFWATAAHAQNSKYPFSNHPFENVDQSDANSKGSRNGEKDGPPPPPDPVPISDHLWLLLILGGTLAYWHLKKRQPATEG